MLGQGGMRLLAAAVAAVVYIGLAAPASAAVKKNPCNEFFEAAAAGPVAESGLLDPSLTSMFAVLRRPADAEDEIPLFNPLNEDIGFQLRSYLPAYIRQLLREQRGDRYFLITGFERSFIPPAKCIPQKLRGDQRGLEEEARRREHTPVYCVVDFGARNPEYEASGCQPFAAVQSGSRLVELAKSTSDVVELVPDGVASVRLTYRGRTVVAAPVAGNAFKFTPPQGPIRRARRLSEAAFSRLLKTAHGHDFSKAIRRIAKLERELRERLRPQTVEWLGAAGQILRQFRPTAEGFGVVGRGSLGAESVLTTTL